MYQYIKIERNQRIIFIIGRNLIARSFYSLAENDGKKCGKSEFQVIIL